MPGFIRIQPGRIVVNEVITDGVATKTGVTGWSAQSGMLRYNSWAAPLPPSSSARVMQTILASTSGTLQVNFSSSVGSAALGAPDYPRVLRICPSTSAFVSANSSAFVTVIGVNQFGATVTDIISLGNGAGPIDGQVAFKTVTSILLPACSSALTPFTVGLSNSFGLDRTTASAGGVIAGVVNGTAETTRPIICAPSTSGTVSPVFALPVTANATAKFSTAATSSTGALVEIFFVPQDTTHI